MKKIKGWDIGLLFLVLLIFTVGIRLYYVKVLMDDVVISEDTYYRVNIIGQTSLFGGGFSLKTLYFVVLYLVYCLLGDLGRAGVCLNVIFQTLTIILFFWYIYHVTKKYYCFRVGMLLAVFPAYIHKISTVSYYNMVVLLLAVLVVIVLMAEKAIEAVFRNKNKNTGNEEVLDVEESVYVDSSMKEIVMADFEDKQVKFLDNPLPVPKRREHKEMDFAIELTPDNDDFDIKELPEGDDFDIE